MDIRCIGCSTRHLDPTTKFIHWVDMYELGEHEDDDVNNLIGDSNYVPTKQICTRFMFQQCTYQYDLLSLLNGFYDYSCIYYYAYV